MVVFKEVNGEGTTIYVVEEGIQSSRDRIDDD